MNDEYKKAPVSLIDGAPLVVEDLDVTMKVVTFQGPVYFGFCKRIWKNFTCKHEISSWFSTKYCKKCGMIK